MFKIQRVFPCRPLNLYKVKQIPNLKIMNDVVHSSATCFFPSNNMLAHPFRFTTVCCAVTARFFTAAHPGFLLFGPWEMASCPSFLTVSDMRRRGGGWLEYVCTAFIGEAIATYFPRMLGVFYEQHERSTELSFLPALDIISPEHFCQLN